jgi:hypothetical protein
MQPKIMIALAQGLSATGGTSGSSASDGRSRLSGARRTPPTFRSGLR